jgi:hypothetical protein
MTNFKDEFCKEKFISVKDPGGSTLWIENTEEAYSKMVREYYNELWEFKGE